MRQGVVEGRNQAEACSYMCLDKYICDRLDSYIRFRIYDETATSDT